MSANIVAIDSRVGNGQNKTLIDGFTQPTEGFILTPEPDGMEQRQARSQNRTGIEALNLSAYNSQLSSLGGSLTQAGDLLLYGRNVAQKSAYYDDSITANVPGSSLGWTTRLT